MIYIIIIANYIKLKYLFTNLDKICIVVQNMYKKIHRHSPSDMKMTPSSFGKRGGVFTGNRITWLFSKKKLKPSE